MSPVAEEYKQKENPNTPSPPSPSRTFSLSLHTCHPTSTAASTARSRFWSPPLALGTDTGRAPSFRQPCPLPPSAPAARSAVGGVRRRRGRCGRAGAAEVGVDPAVGGADPVVVERTSASPSSPMVRARRTVARAPPPPRLARRKLRRATAAQARPDPAVAA